MPTYYNPRKDDVHLVGPSGAKVLIKAGASVELDSYFDKYLTINPSVIRRADANVRQTVLSIPVMRIQHAPTRQQMINKAMGVARRTPDPPVNKTGIIRSQPAVRAQKRPVVGSQVVGSSINADAIKILQKSAKDGGYPISNNVGVGILSYNRGSSLKRLINSIRAHTNLQRTTVFISDDNSTDRYTLAYLTELKRDNNFVVIMNSERLGVAGNSNRLLRCLSRFNNFILLNDDVEVLQSGWDNYYACASKISGIQHFMHNEPGVYGMQSGVVHVINGVYVSTISEKPHGAVLFATKKYLDTVGYFDESFGYYGMEHVDWSSKAFQFGVQPVGYHGLPNSDDYFKIHQDGSAIVDRIELFREAKAKYEHHTSSKCAPSAATMVPSITYVIPMRNTDRGDAIKIVVDNVRAQKFPAIDIILVEQDDTSKIDITSSWLPITHTLVGGEALFNKSLAFNVGVGLVKTDLVILHDADMLAPARYTTQVWETLQHHEACHLGSKVIYADKDSTSNICITGDVIDESVFDRVVGYYEGGSLACHTNVYWAVGGFNEDFKGYGCEDCDFYYRLKNGCKFLSNRCVDLLHLWHSRSPGWEEAHARNKVLSTQLQALPVYWYISSQASKVVHRRGEAI